MNEPRALITGASSGLGAEFARQLASQGKDLVLVARRMLPMEKLAEKLHDEYNVRIDVIKADLENPATPAVLYAEIERRGYVIDYLVNNAGATGPDLLKVRDWQAQQRYLDLMLTSVAHLCHLFIPAMKRGGYGRVINVASVAGLITVSGDYSYGPTKAYLVALSKALNSDLPASGVHVLALCPGYTHTGFHASERLQQMKRETPGFIWYTTDVVVRDALQAVEKGKSVCITGPLYRFAVPILRSRIGQFLIRVFGARVD